MPVTPRSLLAVHIAVYLVFAGPALPHLDLTLLVATAILAALLIWASIHDFQTFEIPDTAAAALAASGAAFWLLSAPEHLATALTGAAIWATAFATLSIAYTHWRRQLGLGLGDAKLIGGIATWTGPVGTISVVLLASLAAAMALLIIRRRAADATDMALAFGPFLCLSARVVWLHGPLEID